MFTSVDGVPSSIRTDQRAYRPEVGEPVTATLCDILSPLEKVTVPVSLPEVAEPDMPKLRAVSARFFRSVNVQVSPVPGLLVVSTRNSFASQVAPTRLALLSSKDDAPHSEAFVTTPWYSVPVVGRVSSTAPPQTDSPWVVGVKSILKRLMELAAAPVSVSNILMSSPATTETVSTVSLALVAVSDIVAPSEVLEPFLYTVPSHEVPDPGAVLV